MAMLTIISEDKAALKALAYMIKTEDQNLSDAIEIETRQDAPFMHCDLSDLSCHLND